MDRRGAEVPRIRSTRYEKGERTARHRALAPGSWSFYGHVRSTLYPSPATGPCDALWPGMPSHSHSTVKSFAVEWECDGMPGHSASHGPVAGEGYNVLLTCP